jgi:hypothetical protein
MTNPIAYQNSFWRWGNFSEASVKKMLRKMDKDNDGKLSKNESNEAELNHDDHTLAIEKVINGMLEDRRPHIEIINIEKDTSLIEERAEVAYSDLKDKRNPNDYYRPRYSIRDTKKTVQPGLLGWIAKRLPFGLGGYVASVTKPTMEAMDINGDGKLGLAELRVAASEWDMEHTNTMDIINGIWDGVTSTIAADPAVVKAKAAAAKEAVAVAQEKGKIEAAAEKAAEAAETAETSNRNPEVAKLLKRIELLSEKIDLITGLEKEADIAYTNMEATRETTICDIATVYDKAAQKVQERLTYNGRRNPFLIFVEKFTSLVPHLIFKKLIPAAVNSISGRNKSEPKQVKTSV